MKVNRKSTPKMVVRSRFNDFARLERKQHQQERMLFTAVLMAIWLVVMFIWSITR